jgi:thioredoxin-related protein
MMRKITLWFLMLAVALVPENAQAQSIFNNRQGIKPIRILWSRYLYDSFKTAVKYRKPLVVYFYQGNCGYCQKMHQEVLSSAQINSLWDQAIFVAVNVAEDEDDKGNVAQLKADLRFTSLPALAVLDVASDWIGERGRIIGYFDANTYYSQLTRILQSPPRRQGQSTATLRP